MHPLIEHRYLRRLAGYVLENKRLLMLTFLSGTLGFAVTFIYPWLLGSLIDGVMARTDAPREERLEYLYWLTAIGLVTPFLFSLAGYARGHFNMLLGNRIVISLRRDLFRHLQHLSLRFHSKERTGTMVNRLLQEVHGVNDLIHAGVILVVLDLLQLLIAFALLWRISPLLTLAVSFVLPCYVLTFYLLNPGVRQASAKVQRELGRLAGTMQEQFAGIALTKAFAMEEREVERLTRDNEEFFGLVARQSQLGHRVGAMSEFFIHLGTGIIIGCAGYFSLRGDGAITPGDLTRFVGYVGILYGPIKRLADLNIVYQNSLAAIRRVFRIFDITPQVVESPNPVCFSPQVGEVVFENVYFRYDGEPGSGEMGLDEEGPAAGRGVSRRMLERSRRWVLDGVNLRARPGEKIALVGPSGSGKTTLVSLLPRLYDVCSGEVRIDGVDVREYSLSSLRHAVAVVQQDPFLFSSTIRENISYGKPDATHEQIVAAAQAANAHEFIERLPDGYDTSLGERGVTLSGGQRQRLAIARAVLCNPRILILDEATSALDAESEALVVQALDRLMEGRTCFIVAHRLSTVRNADRIFTLKDGRIVEDGAHDELLSNNGIYAQLFSKQYGFGPQGISRP